MILDLKEDYDPIKYLKIINTGTINKWSPKWGLSDMTYLGKKYRFPVVSKQRFLDEFKNTYSAKAVKVKLILKGLNLLDVCYDSKGEIIPGKSTLIISGHDEKFSKFLLGYLNTPLAIFYIKEKYPSSSYNQGIGFTRDMINNLPIPKTTHRSIEDVVQLADKILPISNSKDYLVNSEKLSK